MNHKTINLLMEWACLHEEIREISSRVSEIMSTGGDKFYTDISKALEWYKDQFTTDGGERTSPPKIPLLEIFEKYEASFGNVAQEMKVLAKYYEKRKAMRKRVGAIKRSLLATGRALRKHSIIAKLT